MDALVQFLRSKRFNLSGFLDRYTECAVYPVQIVKVK